MITDTELVGCLPILAGFQDNRVEDDSARYARGGVIEQGIMMAMLDRIEYEWDVTISLFRNQTTGLQKESGIVKAPRIEILTACR